MKRTVSVLMASALALTLSAGAPAEASTSTHWPGVHPIPALVSCDWLERNQRMKDLVAIDVRPTADYVAGHLARSVSLPFATPVSTWSAARDELTLETPEPAVLFAALGDAGITKRSKIVIVTSVAQPPATTANATRVAATLAYAGLTDVTILDGGYQRWVAEGRPTTTAVPRVTPRRYRAVVNDDVFVDRAYVEARLGTARLVDARSAEAYSGAAPDTLSDKLGHLPTAVSLPAASIWNADGTYRNWPELAAMARQALGDTGWDDEIIVYCSTGRLATAWQFVLTEVLVYRNVKVYDGSTQDWVRYNDLVV
ncbi:MAG: sulfurtransferase [Actinomycetales bacterium]|nr:sulfurtransferase [Actinomycetales bacterium]